MKGEVLESFNNASPDFSYDAQAKTTKVLDLALDNALMNPDRHRGLGNITVKNVEKLAG